MPYQLYPKAYKSPSDLIAHLQAKGLTVGNPQRSKTVLESINYYRFKIYLVPFSDFATKLFHAGSTFEDGLELYRFDEELRVKLFSIIGRLEIKLRTKLDHTATAHTNNPFWYLDDGLFENPAKINSIRSQLASQFQRSKDAFAKHYNTHYFNSTNHSFKQLPPFWMLSELTTFGNIESIYSSIKKSCFDNAPPKKNELDILAHSFGAKNLRELNNWIVAIRDVRNRCAHHSRIWNANYRQPSGIASFFSPRYSPSHPNRLYQFAGLIHHLNKNLGMGINIKDIMLDLFRRHPVADAKKSSAGFPVNWDQDQFWQ